MTEDGVLRGRKAVFVVGCFLGVLVGASSLYLFLRYSNGSLPSFLDIAVQPSNNAVGNSTVAIFDSEHNRSLRLVQAIGILLPLFTGLLRLTTSDQSDMSEDLTKYLIFGIVTLVLGGVVAVGGLIVTQAPWSLRIALGFVLLTFAVIGFAAVMMFSEVAPEMDDANESEDEGWEEQPLSERIRAFVVSLPRLVKKLDPRKEESESNRKESDDEVDDYTDADGENMPESCESENHEE